MSTISIEKNNLRAVIQAIRKEIELNAHVTLNLNILNVHIEPKPKETGPITDPTRLLPDKFHSETVFDIIARAQKDPWVNLKDAAIELKVHYNTLRKYARFGLIDVEGNQYFGGWSLKRSELERMKSNPDWLKEFQEQIKNKPYPIEEDIFYKKRLEILQEIEDLHKYREPLNPRYAIRHYKGLYQRARRYFGSWYNAIERTGIHYSQVYKKWDSPTGMRGRSSMTKEEWELKRDSLLLKIKKLKEQGLLDNKARRKLDPAVRDYFSGWKNIPDYFEVKHLETNRKKEQILSEVRKLYNQGVPLNFSNMLKNHCRLLGITQYYFGNWPNAIREAGLDYSKIRIRHRKTKKERGLEEENNVQSELLCV
jgi:hypothetical protein